MGFMLFIVGVQLIAFENQSFIPVGKKYQCSMTADINQGKIIQRDKRLIASNIKDLKKYDKLKIIIGFDTYSYTKTYEENNEKWDIYSSPLGKQLHVPQIHKNKIGFGFVQTREYEANKGEIIECMPKKYMDLVVAGKTQINQENEKKIK